jgi:CDP-glucose 4,6-dehydratase
LNILITGASGFVGKALAAALMKARHRVVSMVRDRTVAALGNSIVYGDVRDADFCRRVIADYEIDTVYHLAAQAIVSACAEDPVTALDVAVMGTVRLLQAVRDSGRRIRVIVSTSDKVYGAAPSPYDESTPLDARHSYEVSKACQDLVARMYAHNYGLDVRVVRAVNIYGPGDPNETRLIPKTARRLLRGEPPLLHAGAAGMKRQYVYISDLVRALEVVCERGQAGEAYCVGSHDPPMSVLDVMTRMAEVANVPMVKPEIKERDARFQEIAEQSVVDDKVRALGWSPEIPLTHGLWKTFVWYREQEEKKAAS